ncbi:MAG: galactose mutarotase [Lachnospiraceae bacterium]|nr:galactose mutarotase [Lachnospiraceae bacterium]
MQKRSFGTTKDGQEVFLFSLENKNGVKAEVTNFGANLVNLFVPDKDGNVEDVVLGFDTVSGYETNPSFFGAVIAPSANRIGGASFELNGQTYFLKKNNGENNLHSDEELGSHKKVWDYAEGNNSVTFTLKNFDGELGFPGNKEFKVTYSLDEENGLKISYEASSDKDTIINPTNHSYFNLKGHKEGTIEDHKITLLASNFTPADPTSIPYGDIVSVEGTPMDLRQELVIGEKIDSDYDQLNFAVGYDHNWVTDDYQGQVRKIATVKAPDDIRVMEVYTDLPGVQFYAGNFIDSQSGKAEATYGKRSGLCLETQCYPDSIHKPNFPSVVYGPGKDYQSTTIYKFV